MKYIDAEKLVAGLRHLQERFEFPTYEAIYHLIESLPQEQSDCIYGRTLEEREKYCKFCSAICKTRIEQLEVDLEKFTEKIDAFKARYKHPESISIKGAMAFMARMFYQYPNVARKWYEQLPKVTMD